MFMRRGRVLGVTLALVVGAASLPALAEDDAATRAAARKLAEDGVSALQAGDAGTASQKLEKAYRMLAVPTIALWSARALLKRGALVEAAERYREANRLPASGDAAVQEQAKADAQRELDELTARIPALIIEVSGADAGELTVTLDGQRVPRELLGEERPVNPGAHRVVAKSGSREVTAEVSVAERDKQRVPLSLAVAPSAEPPPRAVSATVPLNDDPNAGSGRKYLGIGLLAAGGIGLAVGGVTGGLAVGKRQSLEDSQSCSESQCDYSKEGDVKNLRTLRTTSTIGFVAGGVLAAAGAVVWLTAPSPAASGGAPRSSFALLVGPSRLSVKGSF